MMSRILKDSSSIAVWMIALRRSVSSAYPAMRTVNRYVSLDPLAVIDILMLRLVCAGFVDVDTRNSAGYTPLMLACRHSSAEAIIQRAN